MWIAAQEGESTNGAVFLIVTDMDKAKKWKEEEVSQRGGRNMMHTTGAGSSECHRCQAQRW